MKLTTPGPTISTAVVRLFDWLLASYRNGKQVFDSLAGWNVNWRAKRDSNQAEPSNVCIAGLAFEIWFRPQSRHWWHLLHKAAISKFKKPVIRKLYASIDGHHP